MQKKKKDLNKNNGIEHQELQHEHSLSFNMSTKDCSQNSDP